jgi:NAD(P)-dependent dehydrogenase (short-subunit alcohol dehydrogenase family)
MKRKSVLVTGASTGIGNAAACRLARNGWRVFATVRRDIDAERVARESSGLVEPVIAELTDAGAVARAASSIDEQCGADGLDALVNNAGIAIAGPLEFLPIDELRRQLEINVTAHVAVTQALLPAIRRANGRIVFIGSIAGRSALPFTGAYCASKFALEAIADSWRIELRPFGIHVTIVEPGVILTPIWDTATAAADSNLARMPDAVNEYYGRALDGLRQKLSKGMKGKTPEDVAQVIERILDSRRPRARYVVGGDARMRLVLNRMPTAVRDAIIAGAVRRM